MNNHFCVGVRGQSMAAAQKLGAKFWEIVNPASECHPARGLFVKYWLVATRQIDDAKTAHAEAGTVSDKNAFVVRTAMHNRLAHAVNRRRINSVIRRRAYDASNTTHALSSHARR